jgi:tol-pal system protein YbgF
VLYLVVVLIWTDFDWDFHTMARATRALIAPLAVMVLTGAVTLCGPGAAFAGQALPLGQGAQGSYQIAQSYGSPPADVGDGGDGYGTGGGGGGYTPSGGGSSSGDAGLVVRVGQLEEQVRQLNGKIEQLQYANKQLQDQMAKFQQDVEFRFQELTHKGAKPLPKRSDLSTPAIPDQAPPMATASATPSNTTTSIIATRPRGARGDDAFDPTRDPGAPGAPRTLGGVTSSADAPPRPGDAASSDAASSDDGPINLLSSPQRSANAAGPQGNPASTGGVPPLRTAPTPAKTGFTPGAGVAAAQPPKEDIDTGIGYLKQKDYEDAERSFAAYIEKNPKSRRLSDAIYLLGETYALSGRQSEAAEQYLKISTHYSSSPRAPDAMLHLGYALVKLGAKEQACATFGEVQRKYPNASTAIKSSAERESKKLQCS